MLCLRGNTFMAVYDNHLGMILNLKIFNVFADISFKRFDQENFSCNVQMGSKNINVFRKKSHLNSLWRKFFKNIALFSKKM